MVLSGTNPIIGKYSPIKSAYKGSKDFGSFCVFSGQISITHDRKPIIKVLGKKRHPPLKQFFFDH